MPIREFNDAEGTHWTVWSTIPYTASGVVASLKEGWLTFQSTLVRKRLTPIPDAWESASDGELRRWCAAAQVPERTPSTGSFRVSKPE